MGAYVNPSRHPLRAGKTMSSTPTTSTDTRKFLLALIVDLADDRNFRACFKAAHRDLHYFFWRLKQSPPSACFVEDLLFDTNGNYPHCDRIDELLQELQLSGVLSRPNPTYRYHDIAVRENPSATEFKASLSPEQMRSYKQIVEDFKRDLGVPAAS
jgi:hypothetical protein